MHIILSLLRPGMQEATSKTLCSQLNVYTSNSKTSLNIASGSQLFPATVTPAYIPSMRISLEHVVSFLFLSSIINYYIFQNMPITKLYGLISGASSLVLTVLFDGLLRQLQIFIFFLRTGIKSGAQ